MSIDIEDLNKSQIILLTLLVSFVTSIATGIVTVSLMEKAPKDVVRVVQRVVEHTVERVEKAAPDSDKKEKVIVQEKTIIIKEGDLIAQAIAQNRTKLYAIYDDEGKFLSFATPTDSNHLVADASKLEKGKVYTLKDHEGKTISAQVDKLSNTRKVAILKSKSKLDPVKLAEDSLKLGNSVFLFTDPSFEKVSQGIVSSLKSQFVFLDINESKILPGAVAFNSAGEIVAISTEFSRREAPNAFVKIISALAIKDEASDDKNNNATSTESSSSENNNKDSNSTSTNALPSKGGSSSKEDLSTQEASAAKSIGGPSNSTSTENSK